MILIWLNSTVTLCCVEGVLSFIVQVHFVGLICLFYLLFVKWISCSVGREKLNQLFLRVSFL